jgi:hypothetical protein
MLPRCWPIYSAIPPWYSAKVLGELDAATADQVDQLLLAANVFDALAAHVVYVARQRGWPALTADPGRLQRVNPDVDLDLL